MALTEMDSSAVLSFIARWADDAGVFGLTQITGGQLSCRAKNSAAPAEFRVSIEQGVVCVSLVTPDRWLSQSIEADLVNTGDSLDELLDEELAEQGFQGKLPGMEHFRSPDKLYTFRSRTPWSPGTLFEAREKVLKVLLAYEAMFRRLGDMESGEGAA
jgi:hypothetical protein